jgi:hypothetical protein
MFECCGHDKHGWLTKIGTLILIGLQNPCIEQEIKKLPSNRRELH